MYSCHDLIYFMHIGQFLLCISKYSAKIFNSLLLEQLIIWIVYLNVNNNSINRHRKKSKLLIVLNLTPICISSNVQYNDEWFVCIVVTGRRDNPFLITSRILNNVSKPTALVRVWINKRGVSLQNQSFQKKPANIVL
jgi:hypothetical protein